MLYVRLMSSSQGEFKANLDPVRLASVTQDDRVSLANW